MHFNRLAFLVPALLFLAGCATMTPVKTPPTPEGNAQTPYELEPPPQVGDIYYIPFGIKVTKEQMLNAVTDERIIYVGETHDNPASHRLELSVLKGLEARYPGKTALGMEMFSRSQQDVVDRWLAGKLDEKEFLRQSRLEESWGYDYYKDILAFAKENKIPIVALNAERSMVHLLGSKNVDQLTDEERAQLPEMDMNDPYQRGMAEAIFGGHEHGKSTLNGFLRVQTLWDETMAQSVADYLAKPEHQDVHMLVMAGGNHIRHGFGIPRRVFRRLPVSYVLIGNKDLVVPEGKQAKLMNVDLPKIPSPAYDYLKFTEYESLDIQHVMLGIRLSDKDGQVAVESVMPDSTAEKAGILANDVIVAFDGQPIKDNFDLVYLVRQKRPGDKAVVQVRRGEETLDLDVTFLPPDAEHPHR